MSLEQFDLEKKERKVSVSRAEERDVLRHLAAAVGHTERKAEQGFAAAQAPLRPLISATQPTRVSYLRAPARAANGA